MERPNNLGNLPRLSLPRRLLFIFLRLFFKLLYNQFAWTYDWVASIVSLGAWQQWITSTLPYLTGPRVLEIGFGPGHLQVSLRQKGIIAIGLDESMAMCRIAQKRLAKSGFDPHLCRGDALTLPFASNSFDQLVMTFPAEYILQPGMLSEIHRVLTAEGKAVLLPLAWITGQKPWERAAAWVNHVTGEAPEWDPRSLEPLIQAGFTVTWEMIDLPTSKILLIHMLKSP